VGLSGEAVRFLAVLVIATPCPLLIAIPIAIIGSISLCAAGDHRQESRVLEQIADAGPRFSTNGTLIMARRTDRTTHRPGFAPKQC